MRKYILLVSALFLSTGILFSQNKTAEAAELIRLGDCEEAIFMLEGIVKDQPKNDEANLQLGLAYLCKGDEKAAEKELLAAVKKGNNDARLHLAELFMKQYRVEEAEDYIDEYRKGLKKGKKVSPDNSRDFDERLDKVNSMLERVEKLVIIDSLEVDADIFFRQYALSKESGSFYLPSSVLSDKENRAEPTVVFETGDKRERFWAIENKDNVYELVSSGALFDNKWDSPVPLGIHLNEGGDANYPFLMSDGMTLYFANDGENSLGGYDIFITRRDGEEFLQPTNIGLPYNSPYNDYLLAIDESKGIGWWATDRNRHEGMVTIYTFIPSDMRINYSVDDPNLASMARIDSYRDTWADGATYKDLLALAKPTTDAIINFEEDKFELNVPGKGIITSVDDFRNPRSKGMIHQYMIALQQYNDYRNELADLRVNYKKGNKSLADKILKLEQTAENSRQNLAKLKNDIVEAESTVR